MSKVISSSLICGVLVVSSAFGANVTLKVIPSQGGNSPTDNIYTTIQEAINASSPSNTTTIEVHDKGSPYKLHDATNLGDEPAHLNFNGKENITMVGYGGTIVIDGNGKKEITIQTNSHDLTLDDFKIIDCDFLASGGGPALSVKGTGHVFESVWLDSNESLAADFNGTTGVTLNNCTISNTSGDGTDTGDGIWIRLDSGDINLNDCTARDNARDGIRLDDCNDVTLTDCHCYQNGRQGLKTRLASWITVSDGSYYSNGSTGIQIETDSFNCVIRDASVYDNNTNAAGEAGIWIDDSTDCLVEDCDVKGNNTGIRVDSDFSTSDIIIRFNRIYSNVPNTTSTGPQHSGVDFAGADRVAFYHNTIWNNGGTNGARGFGTLTSTSTQISFVNNIVGKTGNNLQVELDDGGQYKSFDNNVYFDPPGSPDSTVTAYSVDGTAYKFTGAGSYKDEMDSYALEFISVQSSSNPLESDTTLRPTSGGDAHNKAMALSHVPSKSGSTVTVGNAHFFRAGDSVRFTGTMSGTRTITSISGSVLTLNSSASGTAGTGAFIWLNRSYNGSAPDIGAVER